MVLTRVDLALPGWLHAVVDASSVFATDAEKMTLALDLARRNVGERTGGPFGAAVFGPDDRVLAVGVNCVLPLACSLAHAETMALLLAQRTLGRARLNRDEAGRLAGPFTLAASSQPCCQCFGALIWAGVDRLIFGARTDDVVTLTDFDEGPLPADWIGELERRGIEVVSGLLRDDARAVLAAYTASGGQRY